MGCCGVSSPSDWVTYNSGFQRGDNYDQEARDLVLIGINVPESCCAQAMDKVTNIFTAMNNNIWKAPLLVESIYVDTSAFLP